jgi:PAS domain S-box-containing protein
MRFSISLKINLIIFLVVLSLGSSLGILFITDQRGLLQQELDRRIQIIGQHIAQDVSEAAMLRDEHTINRSLKAAVLDNEIHFVMVKSREGDILASRWTVQTQTGGIHEYSFPLRITKRAPGDPVAERFGPVAAPAGAEIIGYLTVGVNLQTIKTTLSSVIKRTVTAILLAVFVSMVAGYCFIRILLRRSLAPLLTGIAAVGSGELSSRITPDSNDEMGMIGKAFNEMADRLSTTLISKERLEAAVDQRTIELTTALAERSKAQADLTEREERIMLLLNSTAEAIYGIDLNGNCTFCNTSCIRMLGYARPADLIGKNMHPLIHHTKADGSSYPSEECPIYATNRTGKEQHAANEVFWKADGSSMHVEYWSYPVFQGEKHIGAVVTFLDITERRKLEQQLLQAQKMEAIGLLAGGVAHDYNNILMAIMGYGSILQMEMEPDDPLRDNVNQMLTSVDRAAQLTRSLLAFSRKQVLQMNPVHLNEIIVRQEKFLRMIIGEDIEMKTILSCDAVIMADSGQLEQVLMNLATNARDAMPRGGSLTFETDTVNITESFVAAHGFGTPGTYAMFSVTDTGIGMNEETQRQIFEPFFTTKEVGRGTGLGMAIIYGIVKQHNGYINVYSQVGKGTTFKIYIPAHHELAEQQIPLPPSAPVPTGTETILLAEDDPTLRNFFRDLLTKHGYTVVVAENGEDAVNKFTDQHDNIQLVIVDMIMPKLSGRAVYDAAQKIKPDVKVIFSSGYTADKVQHEGLPAGCTFIPKPVTPQEYLRKIREALDG